MEITGYFIPPNFRYFVPSKLTSPSGEVSHPERKPLEGEKFVEKSFDLPSNKWFAVCDGIIYRYEISKEFDFLNHQVSTMLTKVDYSNVEQSFSVLESIANLLGFDLYKMIDKLDQLRKNSAEGYETLFKRLLIEQKTGSKIS